MPSDTPKVNPDEQDDQPKPWYPRAWCRLHADFTTDPKTQEMSEANQRRLVMILGLRCREDLTLLTDAQIARALGISLKALGHTKRLFIRNNFIDERWNIIHWDKRQYEESDSAKRTREYRDRLRHRDVTVTSQERHGDVAVTSQAGHSDVTEASPPRPRVRAQNSDPETDSENSNPNSALATVLDTALDPSSVERLASDATRACPREGEPGYRPGGDAQTVIDAYKANKARLNGVA